MSDPVYFFENIEQVKNELGGKEILLFLDYDGTLTPIVATPDLAVLSDSMRETVLMVSKKITVSVVSGRATDDVRSKVKIDGIFYAGSHGFEIVDPKGKVTINEEAQKIRATIAEVHKKISDMVKDVPGALVEDVKYTISTHYRNVADKDFPQIKKAVEQIVREYPNLHYTQGKKVFEVRPKIAWNKGKAVEWILKVLNYDKDKHVAIYIGDDTTDEDAFKVLKGKGFGIFVATEPRASAAKYKIKDVGEVKEVLEFLMK